MFKYNINDRIFVSYVFPSLLIALSLSILILEKVRNVKITARSDGSISVRVAWCIQAIPCVSVPSCIITGHQPI